MPLDPPRSLRLQCSFCSKPVNIFPRSAPAMTFRANFRNVRFVLSLRRWSNFSTKSWLNHLNYNLYPVFPNRYTTSGGVVYATFFDWPQDNVLHLERPTPTQATVVTLLGLNMKFIWRPAQPSGMNIIVPAINMDELPTPWAWVLKLSNLMNSSIDETK